MAQPIASMQVMDEIVRDVMYNDAIIYAARNICEHALTVEYGDEDFTTALFNFGLDVMEGTMAVLAHRDLEPASQEHVQDLIIQDSLPNFLRAIGVDDDLF